MRVDIESPKIEAFLKSIESTNSQQHGWFLQGVIWRYFNELLEGKKRDGTISEGDLKVLNLYVEAMKNDS